MPKLDYLIVGRVNHPHGLKGEVEVSLLTDFPSRFTSGRSFRLIPPLPRRQKVEVLEAKKRGNKLIVKFNNIDTRDEAESLVGKELVISEKEAISLPSDTYWQHQIIGLKVITTEGEFLGKITAIIRSTSNDVYVVKGVREYLIPAIKDIVKDVNLQKKEMIIQPLPGLLE